jgi:hypothetical protein
MCRGWFSPFLLAAIAEMDWVVSPQESSFETVGGDAIHEAEPRGIPLARLRSFTVPISPGQPIF